MSAVASVSLFPNLGGDYNLKDWLLKKYRHVHKLRSPGVFDVSDVLTSP